MHPIIMKICQNLCMVRFQSVLKKSRVGSKTRSVGHIIEKSCEHSIGHSFGPIIIKHTQNDHLGNISVKSEYGSCQVKN